MRIVEPSVEILTPINGQAIMQHIEQVGRVCYKSEDKITEESAVKFVSGIIRRGHEAVIEHFNITVKFITDRGISHEIVRHRLASYAQESTRYCNYGQDRFGSEIAVIKPSDIPNEGLAFDIWEIAVTKAEKEYFRLLEVGCKTQTARSVLPTCTKTELVMTMNLRELRHFIRLRGAKDAHPDIRILAKDLLRQLKEQIPVVFDDLEVQ